MSTDENRPGGSVGTGMGENHYSPIHRNADGTVYSAGDSYVGTTGVQSIYQIVDEVKQADPENIQQVAASQLALTNSYYENVLAQARRSFVAAVASATIGLAFFIAAVIILLLHNNLRAGTVSAISGGIVEVISGLNFWLYARTATQLNSFHIRLEQTQKYLLANSATKLDGTAREAALTNLIIQIANQPVFEKPSTTDAN